MSYRCEQCGASLALDGVRAACCPYCTSPSFVERPAAPGAPAPGLVIAFTSDAARAGDQLARWLGSRSWFADARVRSARLEGLRGIYVPAYLYSAVADTAYTASIGEHYVVTETVPARGEPAPGVTPGVMSGVTIDLDDGAALGPGAIGRGAVDRARRAARGRPPPETRQVTRTEHRPLAGRHLAYVTDVLVSASRGLADAELAAIEPYDWRALRRYTPAVVTGWFAEDASRSADDCGRVGRAAALEDVAAQLRGFLPGDSHNDLSWRTTVSWESLAPVLVPVWVLAVRYRDDRPALRVLINGQTGAVAGKVPLAGWKVALAIGGLALVIAAIVAVLAGGAPP